MNTTHAAPDDDSESEPSVVEQLTDLATRARTLLTELETFRQHLRAVRQEQHVEVAHFRGTVQSELNMLERVAKRAETNDSSESTNHVVRSSNLPFLETVWNTAKKSKSITALTKRIYFNSPSKSLSQAMHHVNLGTTKRPMAKGSKDAAVTVDSIANEGLLWTKVSLVTNNRLLFDLAKQGWTSDGSDFDQDEENGTGLQHDDDDDFQNIPIVKSARDLCVAAQSYRVRTRKPDVQLILPRIRSGEAEEVDDILDKCRAAGAVIYCGEDLAAAPVLQEALFTMAPDPMSAFSNTLNIDCTILLALVSEFSHAKVSAEPWFHKSLQRQVEVECDENLLPSLLYPALGDHPLVCTTEAATRMRDIVNTIGTLSEKARTAIMMGDDASLSQSDLVREMQKWSAYLVPTNWRLPIEVVDRNEGGCLKLLPAEAQRAGENMTHINKSVFLYGWARNSTTVTSNRVVVKQIESDLQHYEDLDDHVWPKIWLCPTARSLVGKEKRGAKKPESKDVIS